MKKPRKYKKVRILECIVIKTRIKTHLGSNILLGAPGALGVRACVVDSLATHAHVYHNNNNNNAGVYLRRKTSTHCTHTDRQPVVCPVQ